MRILNENALNRDLVMEAIHDDLKRLAEPVIQDAMREIEEKVRERMAVFLMSQIDQQVDMTRFGHTVTISFKMDRGGA